VGLLDSINPFKGLENKAKGLGPLNPLTALNPIKAAYEQGLNPAMPSDEPEAGPVEREALSETNPLEWQTYFQSPTLELAKTIQGRGMGGDPINRSELLNYGAGGNKLGGMAGDALGSRSVSSMSDALSKKVSAQSEAKTKAAKNIMDVQENPELQKSNELARAAEVFGKDQANRMMNFKEQYNYEQERARQAQELLNAQNAATSGVMSNLLGFGVNVAGMAYGK
jgi:hypothetical protein